MLEDLCRAVASRSFHASLKFLQSLWLSLPDEDCRKVYSTVSGDCALYVHIPFCHTPLCRFCCFVRYPFQQHLYEAYMKSLLVELEQIASLAENARIREVYIGGGTPTVSLRGLYRLLDTIRSLFGSIPVSLEAHPRDINREAALELRRLGVSRLSIGVQSFQEWKLLSLGRLSHSVAAAIRAVEESRDLFPTLNIDIVWGVRGEKPQSVFFDASMAFMLKPSQVSFYPLMPPPIHSLREPYMHVEERSLYNAILAAASKHGYKPSTAWCMNKTGGLIDEYVVDYTSFLAAGVSSIGRTNSYAYLNTFSVEKYARKVAEGKTPIARCKQLRALEDYLYELSIHLFNTSSSKLNPSPSRRLLAAITATITKNLVKKFSNHSYLFLAHCMQKGIYSAVNVLRYWGLRSQI